MLHCSGCTLFQPMAPQSLAKSQPRGLADLLPKLGHVASKPSFLAKWAKESQTKLVVILVCTLARRLVQDRIQEFVGEDLPLMLEIATPSPCRAIGTHFCLKSLFCSIPGLAGMCSQKAASLPENPPMQLDCCQVMFPHPGKLFHVAT